MRILFYDNNGNKLSFLNDSGETLTYADAPMPPDDLMAYYQRLNEEIVSWKEDADYTAAQAKKAACAAINEKYAAEIAAIREAIRFMTDTGKSAEKLQTKLTAKYAEWKSELQKVI